MEKLLHECVDCIARAEGEGNASTDECNILLSIPCNKLFIIIEVCLQFLAYQHRLSDGENFVHF